ncbi:DEAD/DEAH box helicase [Ahniella affigens]|nr:DEAD/DEAH box helicase [Ahniella affigens]
MDQNQPSPPHWRALDIDHEWQVALYLPKRYEDFSEPTTAWSTLPVGERHLLVVEPASIDLQGGTTPRLRLTIPDSILGPCYAYLYGAREELAAASEAIRGGRPGFLCTRKDIDGRTTLAISEIVPEKWIGRIRPVYSVRPKSVSAEDARDLIANHLPGALHRASEHLCREAAFLGDESAITFQVGCDGWALADILDQVHRPSSLEYGTHALKALEHLAALVGLWRARSGSDDVPFVAIKLATIERRMKDTGLALTRDQLAAIGHIQGFLARSKRAHVLISGDVGTGKTAVLGVIAAATVDAGFTVVLVAPTGPLAGQLAGQLREWFPDVPVGLVTGEHQELPEQEGAPIMVGTTAVLGFSISGVGVVMVDEQHRFSREQRETFVANGAHLIEASATCIPRTTALAKYGACEVCELRETPYPKTIRTTFFNESEKRDLFAQIRAFVLAGGQLIVVYPERGDPASEPGDPTRTVRDALPRWQQLTPNAEALTGQDDAETKRAVLQRIRDGITQVLVTTTVVEVGIDLPSVRGVLIMHPQHFGVATMHQIRGRVARLGGTGYCWIYAPERLSSASEARVRALVSTTDGFELSRLDLDLRGWGNLAPDSSEQSGADRSIVFGRPISPGAAEAVMPILDQLAVRRAVARTEGAEGEPGQSSPTRQHQGSARGPMI